MICPTGFKSTNQFTFFCHFFSEKKKKKNLKDLGLLEAIEMFIEIARAGQYLHEIGLIHGDLTSNNILRKSMPNHSKGTGPGKTPFANTLNVWPPNKKTPQQKMNVKVDL